MRRADLGYYIAWLGVAIILAYAILKSIGILHSPLYVEAIPLFGFAVAFGGLITTVKRNGEDIREVKSDVKELRNNLNSQRVQEIENRGKVRKIRSRDFL